MSPFSFCMTLGFALSIMMMHINSPFSSGCSDDERDYLLDFKEGLIDYYGRLSSWQGYNCCQWKGVNCDYHTGHVIGLRLKKSPPEYDDEGNKVGPVLGGDISPSLFNLQHLQHLDLSGNNFSRTFVPPQLTKLTRLSYLSLANAEFVGEIPADLGNMTTLQYLDLSNYALESRRFSEWIRNLRNLEYLAMDQVNLTMASEDWGQVLNTLPRLKRIQLTYCGLSGTIPSFLNLTHLSHLHLSGNYFPFPLPDWFQNVSSMVSLHLSDCGLRGSIPSNFMNRSSLSSIMMSYNYLRGNLSFILHHSSSLTALSLTSNSLDGVIPPSIANFSKLEILYLPDNNFTGDIPPFGSALGALSPLSEIYLSMNSLKGCIPSSFGMLYSLRYMVLENNKLSGTIPDTISKLVGLEVLLVSSNNLTGNISLSMFQNLTQLQGLDLSHNQLNISISAVWVPSFVHMYFLGLSSCNIEGYFPAFLSTQYFLEYLDLSKNKLVGEVPTWLWELPSLKMLNLSMNQLEGFLPEVMRRNFFATVDLHSNRFYGSLPALDFVRSLLDLSDNAFNGSIPAIIGSVRVLYLSWNNLDGGIPHFTCSEVNTLEILDLSANSLRDVIPMTLGRCSNLKVLNLAQNDLHGEIPEELGNLTYLATLNLNGNNLQGTIPSSIANCKNLQVFDIAYNKFQGKIPVWIGELAQLIVLSLSFNKFQGRFELQLTNLQNLQVLDLSHNNLWGTIPKNIRKLNAMVKDSSTDKIQQISISLSRGPGYWEPWHASIFVDQVTLWMKGRALRYPKIRGAFKFMDLSHNKLSGNIPAEMGLLKGLVSLNISRNNLSGPIPRTLGDMYNLESLDLSRNLLTGKIPSELVSLTFLAVVNLSCNNLSGLIPQGNQFSTFDASSFLGNPNLHGPPLQNTTISSGSPNITDAADADDDNEMDRWWEVAVGLCYGVGFGIVIAMLCFNITWRWRCFDFMDNVVANLFEL